MQSVEPLRLPWGSARCASPGADLRWGGGGCTPKPYPWLPVQRTLQEALSSKTHRQNPHGLWCTSPAQPCAAPAPAAPSPHLSSPAGEKPLIGVGCASPKSAPASGIGVFAGLPSVKPVCAGPCVHAGVGQKSGSGGVVRSRTDTKRPNSLSASCARPLARNLQAPWLHVPFLRGSELVLVSVIPRGMHKASPTRQVLPHTVGED